MLKKSHFMQAIVWIISLIVICAFTPLNLKTSIPTGVAIAPISSLLAISSLSLLGTLSSTALTIVAQLILIWFNQSNWVNLVVVALTTLFMGWFINFAYADLKTLSHQRLMMVGLTSGLMILVLMEIAYSLIGMQMTGTLIGLGEFARLTLPITLLTALFYTFLIPPLGVLYRFIGRRWIKREKNEEAKERESTIIDLSNHDKNDNQSKDK